MSPSGDRPATAAQVADAESAVRRTLRESALTAALAAARLERIASGSSHHAWHAVTGAGERCFVRLASTTAANLGADLQTEARLLSLAARTGLAPRVLHCDPMRGLLVTEWIDAVASSRPVQADRIRVAAACLARLHALPASPDLRVVDFGRQAVELRDQVPVGTGLESLRVPADRVFDESSALRQPRCVCHNDLNPSNVLVDRTGRMWFVDWEYGGLGDPACDLASFASQHGLDDEGSAALLSAYREHGGRVDARRLELAAWGFDYVQALWYRALAAAPPGAPLDRATALERAARLEISLHHRASRIGRGDNAAFGS